MRKDAINGGDEMLKFISYSNADAKLAQEASKKSQGSLSPKGDFMSQGYASLNHGVGSGNLPNLGRIY